MLVIICLVWWGGRYISLNRQYPNPKEYIAKEGEELVFGNYSYTLQSLKWYDGSIVENILPGYILYYSDFVNNISYPVEKERVLLITIDIQKLTETEETLDLRSVSFEMGAWGNAWNLKLFEALNGEEAYMLELENGETREIVFPVAMYDFQFKEADWESVEENDVNAVLAYYPEKYILRYSEK